MLGGSSGPIVVGDGELDGVSALLGEGVGDDHPVVLGRPIAEVPLIQDDVAIGIGGAGGIESYLHIDYRLSGREDEVGDWGLIPG